MKLLMKAFLMSSIFISSNGFAESIELNSGKQQTTLLELFTSEGCSSCPPAEHWVNGFTDDPRLWNEVIPVAFHVDYWDYIGWKDRFASPENSQRQRRYRQERGISQVYTPGFVSNGKEWKRWFGIKQLDRSEKMPGELRVSILDGVVKAQYLGSEANEIPLKLNIAILGFGIETEIRAGENAGKVLKHDFVMIGKDSQNSYTGQWTLPLPIAQKHEMSRQGIAVWVSSTNRQEPLQAVGGYLN